MTNIRHRFSFFNQSASAVEAFSRPSRGRFDDFTVTHTKSPVIQAEDYYPFGMVASNYRRENSLEQNYLYNGKELQNELGLDWLDYGARMYDASIGRWHVIDPSSDKYFSWTPYSYVFNNPLILIDPDGADPIDPRTGKEYKINLQKAAVINVNNNTYSFDGNLYLKSLNILPWPIGVGKYSPAEGIVGTASAPAIVSISSGAKKALNLEPDERYAPPTLRQFEEASKSGTYSFIDNNFAEEGFYLRFSQNKSVNIVSVENSTVKQISNLTVNDDGKYDINYVRSISSEKSEVREKEVKTLLGKTKTVKYRTITTTESTQFYKDNQKAGRAFERIYKREEKVR